MDNPFIELQNLVKSYSDSPLLESISIQINDASCIGIFGPSGCGKTTLLQIIGCLESPTKGVYKIRGEDVSEKNFLFHRRYTFGFVFQNFQLLKSESALTNVMMPGMIVQKRAFGTASVEQRAKSLLEEVGLKNHFHQDINTMSGGEKQRVAIARALLLSPDCILADEPTGNLDEDAKQMIFSLLLSMVKEHKKTLIMVTHDQSFISSFDQTYHLKHKTLHRIER